MRCQTFSFSFFPCSADHERDWPPCKVVFFGLATNALNVRNNNKQQQQLGDLTATPAGILPCQLPPPRLTRFSFFALPPPPSYDGFLFLFLFAPRDCVLRVFFLFILDIKFVGCTPSLVHKIRLHGRRGKGMAESFSRQKSRHAPQKEGGLKILCDLPPV